MINHSINSKDSLKIENLRKNFQHITRAGYESTLKSDEFSDFINWEG
jgi:hypothetical protein